MPRNYRGAELWIGKALEYNPNDSTSFWNLAEIYENTSRYVAAKEKYEWALQFMPTGNAEAYEAMKTDVEEKVKQIDLKMKR